MEDDGIRSVSRFLLGNRHRLEVVAKIHELTTSLDVEPLVYARQVSSHLSAPADNQVREVFLQLEAAGLLVPVDEKDGSGAKRYRPRESTIWNAAAVFLSELRGAAWAPPPSDGR